MPPDTRSWNVISDVRELFFFSVSNLGKRSWFIESTLQLNFNRHSITKQIIAAELTFASRHRVTPGGRCSVEWNLARPRHRAGNLETGIAGVVDSCAGIEGADIAISTRGSAWVYACNSYGQQIKKGEGKMVWDTRLTPAIMSLVCFPIAFGCSRLDIKFLLGSLSDFGSMGLSKPIKQT